MAITTNIPTIMAASRFDRDPRLEAWSLLILNRLDVKSWGD
jgi:hypothetical protein